MAVGVSLETGEWIEGLEELKQRSRRVMTTRKRSLPLRRGYGSNLPDLVDGKVTASFRIDTFAETAVALADPANELVDEFKLKQVHFEYVDEAVNLALDGEYLLDGSPLWIDGIVIK